MQQRGVSLSGDWTGVYDYSDAPDDPVAFSASMVDVGGVLWGTTTEPNTFAPGLGPDLSADVSGVRSGYEVRFRKTYHRRPPGGEFPIDYHGHVSPDGNRIEGRWRIHVVGVVFGGPFVMNRGRAARATAQAASEIAATQEV